MKVSVIGGSGYVGGELVRLLLQHPEVEISQVTSESNSGKFLHAAHPNLRAQTELTFTPASDIRPCDFLFVALPHGLSASKMREFMKIAPKIIDLSSDFRLKKAEDYMRYYQHDHPEPELLKEFVYGIPELHRAEIKKARYVTGAGCIATTAILSLMPLFKHGLASGTVIVDAKIGSSASGNKPSLSSHHPERSHSVRSFKPTGHRHTAEIEQELAFSGISSIALSATAIEMVRGILTTSQVFLRGSMEEKDIWKVYRREYGDEPFIRIVKQKAGVYRYPEPKILSGSNFCDISFELDCEKNRVVVIGALDNLMKGAAGQGIQCFNIMNGYPENTSLEFSGLHPV
ncbi:MAG: N-acetyl-gamma-glutamyl-phosphate reductase [archaeon]